MTAATTTTDTAAGRVADAFKDITGQPPAGVWAAPGRVNLIGEHTDYNDGLVLPFALEQRVTVAAAPRQRDNWTVTSLNSRQTRTFDQDDLRTGIDGWHAYVAGVVWALRDAGFPVAPADLVLDSDVPSGAGLSSSAALECAVLAAIADLNGIDLDPMARAVLARKAENEFVGAPTGLMDQAASTLATAGHALLLDCRSLDTSQIPLELDRAGLEILVLDTKTPHALVDSEYATRRASCETAAAQLGVPALRDVTDLPAALERIDDPITRRRVRHVVTENNRVEQAAELLRDGRVTELGRLLDASHASMRDDFEITVPTVDLAVETARRCGAVGARMTGGGFGGCIIALVPAGSSSAVATAVTDAFTAVGYRTPAHFVGVPSAGARRLS
ncbi:galactokinase [Microlunatus ginsengisoli]|uniref:Galactokinase n=1 Tax=Microlunatus ginsengisoli TaxID=363863 RepID=A0ABP6ZAY8_9ACTN